MNSHDLFLLTDQNLARDKPTNQSSSLVVDGFSWNSNLAVDGKTDSNDPSLRRRAVEPRALRRKLHGGSLTLEKVWP